MSTRDDFRKKAIHKQIDSNRNIRKVIIPHNVQIGTKNKAISAETIQSLTGTYEKNELIIRKDQADKFTRIELNNAASNRGTTIRFASGGQLKGTIFQGNSSNMNIQTYVKDLVISNFAGAGNVFVQAKGSSGKMYIDAKGGSIFLRKDHTGAQFIFDVANTKAGFGTTAPDRRLHVYAGYIRIGERGTAGSTPSTTSTDRARLELIANANSNNVQALVDARDTGSVTCMQIGTTTEHEIRFYTNSTERMRLANDGKLALGGQIDPDAKLHVYNGYIRIGEKGTFGSTPSTTDRSFSRLELLANANSNNVQCFVDARDDGIAAIMQIGTRTSHGIRFYTGNDERMRLTSGGNLCLGTTSTHNRFHVVDSVVGTIAKFDNTSTNTSADGIIVQCGPDTESNMTTDNTFIFFRDGTGDVVGRIHAESGGGGVTLADSFTGAHVSVMPSEDFEMGLIVDSTGDMWANHMGSVNTALPSVVLSSDDESSKVYGVLSEKDSHPGMVKRWGLPEGKTQVYVNGLGEGKVWVTNKSGDITNGDYITTSIVPGYGMKQSDDILRSCTVAKCAESVDWSQVTDTVTHDGVEYKKYLIGCTYHCS